MQVGKFVWRDCEPASSREVLCLFSLLCISRLRMSGSDNLSLGDAGILPPICAQLQVGTMRSLCVHDSTGWVPSRLSSSTQGHARSTCTLLAVSSRSVTIIFAWRPTPWGCRAPHRRWTSVVAVRYSCPCPTTVVVIQHKSFSFECVHLALQIHAFTVDDVVHPSLQIRSAFR